MNAEKQNEGFTFEEDQLLFLPDECFRKIFKYVDFPSRSNLALVCKRFYELVCDMEKNRHPLEIGYYQVSLNSDYLKLFQKTIYCFLKLLV